MNSSARVFAFGCYGTLVDRDSGLLETIGPLLRAKGRAVEKSEILDFFAMEEADALAGAYRPYREILAQVMRGFAFRHNFSITRSEIDILAESIGSWPLYPDAIESLSRLKQHVRLAVISNIDDDLFAATHEALAHAFDEIITAERAGAYKPCLQNFRVALDVLGVARGELVHVASSLSCDIAPAKAMGIRTIQVDRQEPEGREVDSPVTPDLIVPDLIALADHAALAAGS